MLEGKRVIKGFSTAEALAIARDPRNINIFEMTSRQRGYWDITCGQEKLIGEESHYKGLAMITIVLLGYPLPVKIRA